ncbi:MAG: HAD family phosphatase [Planctomycetes bacterium]|nr:HAD family phosphatase [Planctomycetota bacterium]
MLQAVIFDFDGVICDSEFLHYKALNAVFNRLGVDIPKEVHWATYLGYSDLENIQAVNRDYHMGLSDQQIQQQIAEKKIIFDELAKTDAVIIPGVAEFIQILTDNDIRRAVCSGALRSDIDLMLAGASFANAFEVIISADDVEHGKPDPQGYLLALDRLNQGCGAQIKPSECVVIEDSHWGLEAAAAAGMKPIAVTNTYPKQELDGKAKKIVDRLDVLTIDQLKILCS